MPAGIPGYGQPNPGQVVQPRKAPPSFNHGGMGHQPANPIQWKVARQRADAMSMQQFLKGKGLYSGAIDGIVGPQTRAAQAKWKIVSAHAAAVKAAHDPNAPADPASPGVVPPPMHDTPGSVSGSVPPPPSLASLGLGAIGGGMQGIVSPNNYATATVDAQYGPILAELARQKAQSMRQGSQDQTDIKSWYGALQNDLANLSAHDAQAGDAALGQHDAATTGMLNVIGGNGGVADSAGAFAAAARGNLEGQTLADKHFDAALAPAYRSQRNESLARQLNLDQNTTKELASKILDTTSARGADKVKALYDAQDTAMKQRMALVNMKAELATLPYTVQGAKLDVLGKQMGLKSASLNYDLDNLKYAAGLQQLDGSASGAVPKFGALDPGQLSGLRNQLLAGAVDSKNPTHLGTDPMNVYRSWDAALQSVSNGQWDPNASGMVRTWEDNLIRPFIAPWNKAHPNSRYGFVNGKFTRLTGKGKHK